MSRFSGTHVTVMVVAVCLAVVGAPVAVFAAGGSLVTQTDPYTSAKARVNGAGGAWTTMVDPSTQSQAKVVGGKLQVGDASGPLTVDGTVAVAGKVDVGNVVPRAPFAKQLYEQGSGPSQIEPSFTVPAGQTLVIETVTAGLSLPKGEQPVRVVVITTTGGETVLHFLQFLYQDTYGGYDDFAATQAVRLYADPGSTVYLNAYKNGPGTTWEGRFSVSGYLV
jgi:hypothetical protein